jgi:hypothetical protein
MFVSCVSLVNIDSSVRGSNLALSIDITSCGLHTSRYYVTVLSDAAGLKPLTVSLIN